MNTTQTETKKQEVAQALWAEITRLNQQILAASSWGDRPNAALHAELTAQVAHLRAERQRVLRG